MPIYFSTIQAGRSTESQRAQIAQCITAAHVAVTGAPAWFVNTFFREQADEEGGFRKLPEGNVILVSGNIRSGRDAKAKAEMAERITRGVIDSLGCQLEEVSVVFNSGPASHGMKGGKILPDPGSLEEETEKETLLEASST